MLLPAECLEKLKCSLCNRLLSRFPIYLTEYKDNQSLSICGRCKVPSDDKKYLRATIFESVLKNLQFPCINKQHGCIEYLLPENIEQHELLCQYQSIKCKICEWSGQSFTVFGHYQSRHANLILNNYQFKINIKENSKCSNILLHTDVVFSFERNFDQNMKRIRCTLTPLFSTEINKKYYAQIDLKIDDTTLSKIFPEIDLKQNESKTIDISIENTLIGNSTEATGIINITNNIKEFNFQKQDEENFAKSKSNICTSMVKFDNNFPTSSNQLLNLIYEPCQYGCGYTTISTSDLKQHYDSCLNKQYNCLFTCYKRNQFRSCEELVCRKLFERHIMDKHLVDLVAGSIKIGIFASKRYCKCLIDNRKNCFILIIQRVDPHLFLWRVEVVQSNKNVYNYSFEIVMFNEKNNVKVSLRAPCAELTCNKNYNISDTPCIWLHLDQIKHFISNNALSFEISIYNGNDLLISE